MTEAVFTTDTIFSSFLGSQLLHHFVVKHQSWLNRSLETSDERKVTKVKKKSVLYRKSERFQSRKSHLVIKWKTLFLCMFFSIDFTSLRSYGKSCLFLLFFLQQSLRGFESSTRISMMTRTRRRA